MIFCLKKIVAVSQANSEGYGDNWVDIEKNKKFIFDTPFVYDYDTNVPENAKRISIEFKIPTDWVFKRNPLNEQIVQDIYEFGKQCGFFSVEEEYKDGVLHKLKSLKFIDLAINILPEMQDRDKLGIIAKWILILFKFDDLIDEQNSPFKDVSLAKELVGLLTQSLYGNTSSLVPFLSQIKSQEHKDRVNQLVSAIKSLQEALKLAKTPTKDFNKSVAQYFDSAVNELETAEVVDLATYLEHRKVSGAVPTVTILSYALEGLVIPDAIKSSYAFKNMEACSNVAICLVNDGVSGKEWEGHEPNFIKMKFKDALEAGHAEGSAIVLAHSQTSTVHDFQIQQYQDHKLELFEQIKSGDIFKNDPDIYSELQTSQLKSIQKVKETWGGVAYKISQTLENLILSNLYYSKETSRYRLDHDINFR